MKRTIYKYTLDEIGGQYVEMPMGATILCVQLQNGRPTLWALVNPEQPEQRRDIRIYGTGHPIESDMRRYIGTYQLNDGQFVFHVFEAL